MNFFSFLWHKYFRKKEYENLTDKERVIFERAKGLFEDAKKKHSDANLSHILGLDNPPTDKK